MILESIIECGISLANAGLVGDVELTVPFRFFAMAQAEANGSRKFTPPPTFNGVPDPIYKEPKLPTPTGLESLKVITPCGVITLRCGSIPQRAAPHQDPHDESCPGSEEGSHCHRCGSCDGGLCICYAR